MKTTAMKAPTPAIEIRKVRIASSSEEYAFAILPSRLLVSALARVRGS